jgi:hypothetical protein
MSDIPIIDSRPEWTRWRNIDHPLRADDVLGENSIRYEEGKLPTGFILLTWDGKHLRGLVSFKTEDEATNFLTDHALRFGLSIESYLVLPKP